MSGFDAISESRSISHADGARVVVVVVVVVVVGAAVDVAARCWASMRAIKR